MLPQRKLGALMGRLELDFAHLCAGELDDQALAEISALLSGTGERPPPPASWLIGVASSGGLIVARRPCGSQPEIIGVAARGPAESAGEILVAIDAASAARDLAADLRRRLEAAPTTSSLFRRRDKAPFGLA